MLGLIVTDLDTCNSYRSQQKRDSENTLYLFTLHLGDALMPNTEVIFQVNLKEN